MAISINNPTPTPPYSVDPYESTPPWTISGAVGTVTLHLYANGQNSGVPSGFQANVWFIKDVTHGTIISTAGQAETDNGGAGWALPSGCTQIALVAYVGTITQLLTMSFRVYVSDGTSAWNDNTLYIQANPTTINWLWRGVNGEVVDDNKLHTWAGRGGDDNYVALMGHLTDWRTPQIYGSTSTVNFTINTWSGPWTSGKEPFLVWPGGGGGGVLTVTDRAQDDLGRVQLVIPSGNPSTGLVVQISIACYQNPAIHIEKQIFIDSPTPCYTLITPGYGVVFTPSYTQQEYDYEQFLPPAASGYSSYGSDFRQNATSSPNTLSLVPSKFYGRSGKVYGTASILDQTQAVLGSWTSFPYNSYPVGSRYDTVLGKNVSFFTTFFTWQPDLQYTISPDTLSAGIQNSSYSALISLVGTPIPVPSCSWSLLAAPAGMTTLTNNGNNTATFTGTPTTAGTFLVKIRASVGASNYEKEYSWTIAPAGTNPTITSVSPNVLSVTGTQAITILGTNLNVPAATNLPKFKYQASTPGWTPEYTPAGIQTYTSTSIVCTQPSGYMFPGMYTANLYNAAGTTLLTSFRDAFEVFASTTTPRLDSVWPSSGYIGSGFTLTCSGANFAVGGGGSTIGILHSTEVGALHDLTTNRISSTTLTASCTSGTWYKNTGVYWVDVTTNGVKTNAGLSIAIYGATVDFSPKAFTASPGAFSATMTGSGGSGTGYVFALTGNGTPPVGISLATNGTLSGTVTAGVSQTSTFGVRCTDSLGATATANVTITISGGQLSITTPPLLPNAPHDSLYDQTILASGGTGTITWDSALVSGSLPTGITWNATTHKFYGTPTADGDIGTTFSAQVRVQDSSGPPQTATQTFQIKVVAAASSPTISNITPISGPTAGGTLVTITGTNFTFNPSPPGPDKSAGVKIYFGTNLATNVESLTGTTLTCITPSAATPAVVNVMVKNPDGGSKTLNGAFTYTLALPPTITSINKPDGPFAGGRQITLFGANFTGTTEVRINNVLCSGVIIDSDAQLRCYTPAYTGGVQTTKVVVNITVKNSAGTGIFPNGYTYRPAPKVTAVTPDQASTTGGTTTFISGQHFFSRGNNKPRVFIGGVEVDASKITLVGGDT